MVTPTSILMHSANMDHDCQMSPQGGAEANINNALHPQFGQAIDTNLSSWELLHHIGTY